MPEASLLVYTPKKHLLRGNGQSLIPKNGMIEINRLRDKVATQSLSEEQEA